MATSSKVKFKLESLRDKAVASIDARLVRKQKELEEFDESDALQEKVSAWRDRQNERLRELLDADVDNQTLSTFRIEPIPATPTWGRSHVEREIKNLIATRDRVIAKSESLVPDADGNISLTKTQLKEFFEL